MLKRVSPFRHLRIVGCLLLPEAFRSLSRLSSALSAKASSLRSCSLNLFHIYSVIYGRVWFYFLDVFSISRFFDSSVCGFQGTCGVSGIAFLSCLKHNGDGEIRTLDPLLARQVLSQLSYTPMGSCFFCFLLCTFMDFLPLGLSGLEPPTSRLSGVRSNQLSYKPFFWLWQPPAFPHRLQCSIIGRLGLNLRVRDGDGCFPQAHRHQICCIKFLVVLIKDKR